jgi:maleate isomerase
VGETVDRTINFRASAATTPHRRRMYGHRARIGYTSPPITAEVFPYEFYKIAPEGVTLALTTLAVTNNNKNELDQSYARSIAAARSMVEAGVDAVVFAGVPLIFSRGEQNNQAIVSGLESMLGVHVSTTAAAQEKAAKTLGCKRVVIAHAYDASQHERQKSYAEKIGCEVLGISGWGTVLPKFGSVPRDAAYEMGRTLLQKHPEADSIFFPSMQWPTIEAIDTLEKEFNVNVVSATQAAVWDGLRLVGITDKIEGYGRLFSEF